MEDRSVSRELALLLLGQLTSDDSTKISSLSIEVILGKALESLSQHWRDELDLCANNIEKAQQELLESELFDDKANSTIKVREYLKICLNQAETILNSLSESAELPKLLLLSDQKETRQSALHRVSLVINKQEEIDASLDRVMEGWRFKRLPRIDRDILRLALVDLIDLKTPTAVTCNEAVNLANRYSDVQGRRMINGVLRRFQTFSITNEVTK